MQLLYAKDLNEIKKINKEQIIKNINENHSKTTVAQRMLESLLWGLLGAVVMVIICSIISIIPLEGEPLHNRFIFVIIGGFIVAFIIAMSIYMYKMRTSIRKFKTIMDKQLNDGDFIQAICDEPDIMTTSSIIDNYAQYQRLINALDNRDVVETTYKYTDIEIKIQEDNGDIKSHTFYYVKCIENNTITECTIRIEDDYSITWLKPYNKPDSDKKGDKE